MENFPTESAAANQTESLPQRVQMGVFIFLFCIIYTSTFCGAYIFTETTATEHYTNLNNIFLLGTAALIRWIFKREHHRSFLFSEYRTILISSIIFDILLQFVPIFYYFGLSIKLDKIPGIILILFGHALMLALGFSPWTRLTAKENQVSTA